MDGAPPAELFGSTFAEQEQLNNGSASASASAFDSSANATPSAQADTSVEVPPGLSSQPSPLSDTAPGQTLVAETSLPVSGQPSRATSALASADGGEGPADPVHDEFQDHSNHDAQGEDVNEAEGEDDDDDLFGDDASEDVGAEEQSASEGNAVEGVMGAAAVESPLRTDHQSVAAPAAVATDDAKSGNDSADASVTSAPAQAIMDGLSAEQSASAAQPSPQLDATQSPEQVSAPSERPAEAQSIAEDPAKPDEVAPSRIRSDDATEPTSAVEPAPSIASATDLQPSPTASSFQPPVTSETAPELPQPASDPIPAPTTAPATAPQALPSAPLPNSAQMQKMRNNNEPLPEALRQQFTAKFNMPAPTTHGQLQIFLWQQAQARQQQQAAAALMRQRASQQQQAQKVTGASSAGPTPAGLAAASTTAEVNSKSPPPASQPPVADASAAGFMPAPAISISSQLERIANGPPAQADRSRSSSQPPVPATGAAAASSSPTPSTSNGHALPSARPGSSGGSDRGLPSGSSINQSPVQSTISASPRDLGGVAGMGFARHIPANMDVNDIKRQMLALQQSQNRRMSVNTPNAQPSSLNMGHVLGHLAGERSASSPSSSPAGDADKPAMNGESNHPPRSASADQATLAQARIFEAQQAQAKMVQAMQQQQQQQQQQQPQQQPQQRLPEQQSSGPSAATESAQQAASSAPVRPSGLPAGSQPQFIAILKSLSGFYQANGHPPPPGLFQSQPADPNQPNSTPTPFGQLDVGGAKLEVARFFATVVQAGGSAKMTATQAWPKLASFFQLPQILPEAHSLSLPQGGVQQVTTSAEYLETLYNHYLAAFEAHFRNSRQVANARAHSESSSAPADGQTQGRSTAPPAQEQSVASSTSANQQPTQSSVPEQPHVETPKQPADSAETAKAEPETPQAEAPKKTKKKPVKKGTSKDAVDEPAPDTPSGSKRPATEPPPPRNKRPRFKVEYSPYTREPDTYGGWNLDMVNNFHHVTRSLRSITSVNDLGIVDIDVLSMSLRSRVSSELSYALTVLDILSMPGEGDDKGGLGLAHCGDLLAELVDLIEETVFGDDGWAGWVKHAADAAPLSPSTDRPSKMTFSQLLKGKWRADHSTLTSLALDMEEDCLDNAISSRRRIDCVHVAVNLLRNFSMMSDNFAFLADSTDLLNLMARLGDLRLAQPQSRLDVSSAAQFTLSDVLRLRKDVLDILINLASHIKFPQLPLDTSAGIIDLMTSFLPSTNDAHRLVQPAPHMFAHQAPQAPLRVEEILDAISRLTHSDRNRRVLRQLPDATIVGLFETLVRMLPVNFSEERQLRSTSFWLEYYARVASCLFNVAFAASLNQRLLLRNIGGVTTIIPRLVEHLTQDGPQQPFIICRRLCEILGILNGPDHLTNDGTGMSFGCEANGGGLKGWTGSNRAMEAGWLAHREDTLVNLLAVPRPRMSLDPQVFAELERVIWAE